MSSKNLIALAQLHGIAATSQLSQLDESDVTTLTSAAAADTKSKLDLRDAVAAAMLGEAAAQPPRRAITRAEAITEAAAAPGRHIVPPPKPPAVAKPLRIESEPATRAPSVETDDVQSTRPVQGIAKNGGTLQKRALGTVYEQLIKSFIKFHLPPEFDVEGPDIPLHALIRADSAKDKELASYLFRSSIDLLICNAATKVPHVIIEIQGNHHESKVQQQRDARKLKCLHDAGYDVLYAFLDFRPVLEFWDPADDRVSREALLPDAAAVKSLIEWTLDFPTRGAL